MVAPEVNIVWPRPDLYTPLTHRLNETDSVTPNRIQDVYGIMGWKN